MVITIYGSNCSIKKNDALVWSSMINDDGTIVNLRPKFDGLKVHILLMCFIYNVTVIGKKVNLTMKHFGKNLPMYRQINGN